MKEYAYDIKLFAVVRVKAGNEARALSLVREFSDLLDIGMVIDSHNNAYLSAGEEVTYTEASMDGEPCLLDEDEL